MVGNWPGFVLWSEAMERALYGPRGFYRAQGGPAAHFRTSVHASPLFAAAIVRLLREVDEALGHPDELTLVDVGAGRGELLEAVHAHLAAGETDSTDGTDGTGSAGSTGSTGSTDPTDRTDDANHAIDAPGTHTADIRSTADSSTTTRAHAPDTPSTATSGSTATNAAAPAAPADPADSSHSADPAHSAHSADPGHSADAGRSARSAHSAHSAHSADRLASRLSLIAVEVAPRPDNLTSSIVWRNELPPVGSVTGLLVANEWLDNVPCDVVQWTCDGWRHIEVAADGTERLGAKPTPEQLAWLTAWWPTDGSPPSPPSTSDRPANRAEIGLTRDEAWQRAVATLARGVAVAIDYAHTLASRPPFGSLTGYAQGRQTVPVPDGSCDITAHVALDACAAAAMHAASAAPAATVDALTDTAAASRADWTVITTQRAVLHSLGITGARPDLSLASRDPRCYLRALSQASAAAELTDANGLGSFGWLAQGVAAPVPPSLAQSADT